MILGVNFVEGKVYIVIPSLDPDEKLQKTVEGLREVGFDRFLLVDDGSNKKNRKFFPPEEEGLTLLRLSQNRGKGAALKTAFRHLIHNCDDVAGVITVDGDGQHLPKDVLACKEELLSNEDTVILGCRDFSLPDVPARSRFGNKSTSLVFKLLCGINISDTQTGLRAFPASMLPLLIKIEGSRFEYETNMLLKFGQKGIKWKEVKIDTVYIEENKTSHFHPIKDSIRIYKFVLSYFISSIVSFVTDIAAFYILCRLLSSLLLGFTEAASTALARVISSFVNYSINRKKVFKSEAKAKDTLLKYYALAVPQMLISAGLVTMLSALLSTGAGGSTLIKIVVDTVLFFLSYRIQRSWVFSDKKTEKKPKKHAEEKKEKLTAGKIVKRSLLSVGTAIGMVLVTVISACIVICYGPSESLRDMLVISAKQASATKWVPGLFLSKETVDNIMENSQKLNTDSIDSSDYTEVADQDEWEDAIDGMKLIFIREPKYKAYLLLVKDPARVTVGVSSENFKSATEGKRIFDMVAKYNAVAAINGGEFLDAGGVGNGARPMGLTYSGGKMVWSDGLKRTFIGFDKNNRLICRESMTQKEAEALGIRDAVSFQNGNVLITQKGDKIDLHYGDLNTGTAQRTAIGQRADGTVIMLVTDGRCADSIGASRNDVIDIMSKYGAVNAGMLDGGSSAMLYYRDYFNKYTVNTDELDEYQKRGLVNRYKAFTNPRRIPTYFIITGE